MEENKNDVPMIELYKVDAAMAHTSKIVHDVKVIVAICMTAILAITISIVLIFTTKYNERTSDWLKTYNMLRSGQAEVYNENTENLQQCPIP